MKYTANGIVFSKKNMYHKNIFEKGCQLLEFLYSGKFKNWNEQILL